MEVQNFFQVGNIFDTLWHQWSGSLNAIISCRRNSRGFLLFLLAWCVCPVQFEILTIKLLTRYSQCGHFQVDRERGIFGERRDCMQLKNWMMIRGRENKNRGLLRHFFTQDAWFFRHLFVWGENSWRKLKVLLKEKICPKNWKQLLFFSTVISWESPSESEKFLEFSVLIELFRFNQVINMQQNCFYRVTSPLWTSDFSLAILSLSNVCGRSV